MNQFAKISPLVTSSGELLKQDPNGDFTLHTGTYLKRNECGICVEDLAIICMYDKGKGNLTPIRLTGKEFNNSQEVLDCIKNNIDKELDGVIISPKEDPTNIYTVTGTELYKITENLTKKVSLEFTVDKLDPIVISNSDIRSQNEYVTGNYTIDYIIVTVGGDNYTDLLGNDIGLAIKLQSSVTEPVVLDITDKNTINTFMVNSILRGDLTVSLINKTLNDDNTTFTEKTIRNGDLSSFSKLTISIFYTPIK